MMKFLDLESKVEARIKDDLCRERLAIDSAQGSELVVGGKTYLNFSSNDYLGLATSDVSKKAIKIAVDKFGFGSGASHLVCGHQSPHDAFEKEVASFLNRDSAISFSSGYMANLGVIQALTKKGDLILADKLNHASLIDGVKLSHADSYRYQHANMSSLQRRLSQSSQNTFVITDSVFSMDGDLAPVDEIAMLCEKHNAILIVDDAHGFGVLGENGEGIAEHFNLNQKKLPVLVSALGKALGGVGAVVSGSKALVDYLIQFSRNYIYTTAMPASCAAANLANLHALEKKTILLKTLRENIQLFKSECEQVGIQLMESDTAIQPLVVGDNKKLVDINKKLKNLGFLVGAIRPPTVPKNSARLRITISASHEPLQIKMLASALKQVL